MVTRIIFVRHGETDGNALGVITGSTDVALSKKGKKQAKALAKRLKNEDIDFIYSSPLQRARVTAQTISKPRKMKIVEDEDIRERGFGEWEGKNYLKHVDKLYKGEKFDFARPKGGENMYDVEKRGLRFFNKILKKHKNKTILVSSHGGIGITLIGHYLHIPVKYRHRLSMANCAVSLIEFSNGSHKVKIVNDYSHTNGIK